MVKAKAASPRVVAADLNRRGIIERRELVRPAGALRKTHGE